MRVLFVVDSVYPVTSAAAVRILSFVRGFSGPDAEVLGGVTGDIPAASEAIHVIRRNAARKGAAFALSWLSFLIRLHFRLWRLARRARFDVIVVSVPKYELLWSVPLVRRHCALLAVDVRDSPEFVDYTDHFGQFLPRFLARPFGKAAGATVSRALERQLDAAGLISVANEGIATRLSRWNSKIRIVANGVDTRRFKPGSHRQPSIDRLELVYMGNFAGKDRFEWVYEGLPRVNGAVRVNLVGDGRRKQEVLRTLERLDVVFCDHGVIEHSRMPRLLDSMHVGFLFRDAYADESIPVAFFEFASMNIPVICNDVGISGPFVREHGCGFVVETCAQFVDVLSDLVTQPAALAGFSHLHALAQREFSRDVQAERLMAELRGALVDAHRLP